MTTTTPAPDRTGPRAYTLDEVAERLAISTGSVRRLIESRALAAVDMRIPGAARARLRVNATELERFLRDRNLTPRRVGRPKVGAA